MSNLNFENNKFNLTVQDIDKLYRIMDNLKRDRGYSVSTIVLMVMERFDYTGIDMYNFLVDVYFNWGAYLNSNNNNG